MLKDQEEFGWFKFFLIFLFGAFLIFLTYMIYQNSAWEDNLALRSPIVCMKITARERGAGTLKLPDKIYAEYKGKTYNLSLGRKSFRSLMGVDSIAVSYDAVSDKAVLPMSGRVRHYAFLFVMMGGLGVVIIWENIRQMIKFLKSGTTKPE